MRMERINAWLGLSGNIAVLLGLVFLAIEINGNTASLRAQELANLNAIRAERQILMASDPDMRALYVKSLSHPSELTLEELWGLTAYLSSRITGLLNMYRRYQDGITTRADWEDNLRQVPVYLGGSFGQVFWSTVKDDFSHSADFVEAVDSSIAKGAVIPDDEWLPMFQERVLESGL